MNPIRLEEARELLAPYHLPLLECFHEAFRVWQTTVSHQAPSALGRDVKNSLSMLIDEQFRSRLGAESGITIRVVNERVLAYVKDRMILHNKAFRDGQLNTSNNPTKASLAFDQGHQVEGIPDFARACVGYRLDRLHTKIAGVFVRANQTSSNRWYYEIGREEPRAVVLPFRKSETHAATRTKRFRPKKSKEPKKGKSVDGEPKGDE